VFIEGVYLDFAFKGSRTVLLSLHNKDQLNQPSNKQFINSPPRLSFLPLTNVSDAAPISLLARVDDEDYIVLPNASSTTTIRHGNLDPNSRHDIRIIAPMVSRDSLETLQVEGIWIDEGAHLLPYDASSTGSDDKLSPVDQNNHASSVKHKMLEIVTDLPGSKVANGKRRNSGITHEVLDGVMGWEFLLGEMFGSDHVTIGMDGMCLIQDCIGGVGSPVGLADVFFQRFSAPLMLSAHN
jgi:hypothetical protein